MELDRIQVLVVDDEHYSRDELKHLLGEFPFIKIVGEADSGEAAIMKCLQLQPDVVFLDVEMPKLNGMEVAKSLKELKKVPKIVFATAYPQFAVEAFRYEAADYILKPYDDTQIEDTIKRLAKLLVIKDDNESIKTAGKLAVEDEGEIVYIEPRDVKYIFREEKNTKIVTTTGEFEVRTPLKDLESRLIQYPFFRIHKSYLVNLDYVLKLIPWFSGSYQLEMVNCKEKLPVSRNYVKSLRTRLEL